MTATVSDITHVGFWLALEERELFVSFDDFPWFKNSSVSAIQNVEHLNEHHLYWPDMDIDLAVESIEHPERFPLLAQEREPE